MANDGANTTLLSKRPDRSVTGRHHQRRRLGGQQEVVQVGLVRQTETIVGRPSQARRGHLCRPTDVSIPTAQAVGSSPGAIDRHVERSPLTRS